MSTGPSRSPSRAPRTTSTRATTLFIPGGAIHAFANTGDVDATALAIITPGLLGADYFREVAAVLDARHGRPTRPRRDRRSDATPRPHSRPLDRKPR